MKLARFVGFLSKKESDRNILSVAFIIGRLAYLENPSNLKSRIVIV